MRGRGGAFKPYKTGGMRGCNSEQAAVTKIVAPGSQDFSGFPAGPVGPVGPPSLSVLATNAAERLRQKAREDSTCSGFIVVQLLVWPSGMASAVLHDEGSDCSEI